MIEEGLYDSDPTYVRATIYERIFGKIPVAGYEFHDGVVDKEKLEKWIADEGFEVFHFKQTEYHEDGELRNLQYFINKNTEVMIMYKHSNMDVPTTVGPHRKSHAFSEEREKNPNKVVYFSFFASNKELIKKCRDFVNTIWIKEETRCKLYMLKSTDYGSLELDSFPTNCDEMSLELNYGKHFLKTHEKITDTLKTKKSGLYIFHGPPGTGKTSFIKYLTTVIEDRKFIFVPNMMVAELFSPKLVDKLYAFKNSVLVLEDAEVAVFKRNGSNNELVSGILNITDGLLKDLLNISIVVTFNAAEIHELDEALLRKGRLQIMHEFGLLSLEDAKRLAKHLNKKKKVDRSMSLADVYNLDEDTGIEDVTEKKVGFSMIQK